MKITDFGISRATDHVPLTRSGTVVGTAFYLSPEQAMGRKITPASDVYALGVVGYECLAGHRPFEAESSVAVALAHVNQEPPPLPTEIPGPIRALVMRAMAKDPADRFPDGDALAAAIQTVTGEQMSATQVNTDPVPVPFPARDADVRAAEDMAAPLADEPATAEIPAALAALTSSPFTDDEEPPALTALSRDKPPRRRRVSALALVAALLVAGIVAVIVTSQQDGAANASGSGSNAMATGPLVLVDTASYVGQPIDEVEAALTALGLVVVRNPVEVSGQVLQSAGLQDQPFARNAVFGTDPAQVEVPGGTTVTVSFAMRGYQPSGSNGGGTVGGASDTPSATPSTAPSATPTATPSATPTPTADPTPSATPSPPTTSTPPPPAPAP